MKLELSAIVDHLRKLWIPGEPLPPAEEFAHVDLGRRQLLKLIGVGAAVAAAAPLTKTLFVPVERELLSPLAFSFPIEYSKLQDIVTAPIYDERGLPISQVVALQLEHVRPYLLKVIDKDCSSVSLSQVKRRYPRYKA